MTLYRIVIGDDDPVFLKELEGAVRDCLTGDGLVLGRDFETAGFQSPGRLLDALQAQPGNVQLLLLDVEFGPANGLELAAKLRERDGAFSLVYITSHQDYVFDSFDTKPLHYLLKPPDRGKLGAILREDYHRRVLEGKLLLSSGGKHLSLAYGDIYCAEAAQHRVLLHLRDGVMEWPSTLAALGARLPQWSFCQCHFSYFINLSHVTQLIRYEARMDNGAVVPVSKRCYNQTYEQYVAYLKQ